MQIYASLRGHTPCTMHEAELESLVGAGNGRAEEAGGEGNPKNCPEELNSELVLAFAPFVPFYLLALFPFQASFFFFFCHSEPACDKKPRNEFERVDVETIGRGKEGGGSIDAFLADTEAWRALFPLN